MTMVSTTLRAALMTTTIVAVTAQQFVQYTPGGDDTLVERMDSIVSPGVIAAHVHQIFGAQNISPNMSYDSLRASTCTTVGGTGGYGNSDDRSAYWHPSLYMQAKDGSGYIRVPTSGHKLYYKDAGSQNDQKREPFEFPEGFRMIAGEQLMRAAASDPQRQNITQWICHRNNAKSNQGTDGGFPNGVTDCDAYPGFNGAIHFPHCWNGQDFNQEQPGAHIAYPDGDIQNGQCPSTHPIRLPHIFMENQFDLHSIVDLVVPDSFVLSQGDATGYGWHADFFNGWTSGAIPSLFEQCPHPKYGNEDISTCPNLKQTAIKAADCKLQSTFTENVDKPGQALPGCNPVSKLNPAIKFVIAALGISTDQCSHAASSGGSGSGNSSTADTGSSSGSGLGGLVSSAVAAVSSVAAAAPSAIESLAPALSALPATLLSHAESFKASPLSLFYTSTTMATRTRDREHLQAVTEAPTYGATVVVQEVVTATAYVTVEARRFHEHIRAHLHRRS